jgi:purine-binding chemotaxis protein CheW
MSQYATFHLGDRLFGLEIMRIREINRNLEITPVPHARDHVRGLINLRGQIVTILDLGVRLGLSRQPVGEATHNLILKTRGDLAGADAAVLAGASADQAGFLVDAIGDVVEADETALEPPSANVGEADVRFLSGVLRTDAGLLVLLDLREILYGE